MSNLAPNAASGEMYRAGLPSPGARLLAAIKLVCPGQPVADIGCDHGKLAVYLALAGIVPKVVAVDIRPLPLARAKALVQQTGCGHIVGCRLGNGLAAVQPGEVQQVVIAGMSGETMIEILEAAPWVQAQGMRFVFVPATRATQLRRWLYAGGFALLKEQAVEENGKVYTAMLAEYTGAAAKATPLMCELGLLAGQTAPAAQAYIARRLAHLRKRALAPLPPAEKQALNQLIKEVEQCLQ